VPGRRPTHLYKYVPAARVDILRNARVRFTPPAVFNDPFELRPALHLAVMGSEVEAHGLRAPAAFDAHLDRGFTRDKRRAEELRGEIGVLSLTADAQNLLMWSHYADHHRGFLLEFDARHPFFDQRRSRDDALHHLRPVRYARERPRTVIDHFHHPAVLLTKSLEWKYEREWRMLVDLGRFGCEVVGAQGEEIHLAPLPPRSITGIVFGARMPEEMRAEIAAFVAGDARYAHVAVCGAELNGQDFKLDFHRGQPHYERAVELLRRAHLLPGPAAGGRGGEADPEWAALHHQALAEVDRALRYQPASCDYWYLRAGCHDRLGRLETALSDYGRALAAAPASLAPELRRIRGYVLARLGRYADAVPDLERAPADDEECAAILDAVRRAAKGPKAARRKRRPPTPGR
jgi:tetratricopeptide (TPR) repeat protein